MKLQTRLQRLEQTAVRQGPRLDKPMAPSADEEQKLAYLRGEGPPPPCPPRIDSLKWDSELRIECCLLARVRGALDKGEYLPNMSADERREVDDCVKAIAQWDWAPPWFKEPEPATTSTHHLPR
jgi:hypothetical protein